MGVAFFILFSNERFNLFNTYTLLINNYPKSEHAKDAKDKLLAWKTAPAGTEPPGWEWLWELESQGPDSTLVRHTYDWSKVTDKDLLQQVGFPLITEQQLEDTLSRLAAEAATL